MNSIVLVKRVGAAGLAFVISLRTGLAVLVVILLLNGCSPDTEPSSANVDAAGTAEAITDSAITSTTVSDTAMASRPLFRIGSVINFFGAPIEQDIQLWLGQVFSEIGVGVELAFIPGRRLMVDLSQGVLDGDLIRAEDISKGFENIVRVPQPWLNTCIIVVGLQQKQSAYQAQLLSRHALSQDKPQPAALDTASQQNQSVATRRVGVISGAPYVNRAVYNRWPDAELEEYQSDRQTLLMLLNDRIDFVVMPHLNWDELQRKAALPLALYDVLSREQVYLHLYRNHAHHLPALSAAIKKHAARVQHLNCKY